jgi:hypothetical protein
MGYIISFLLGIFVATVGISGVANNSGIVGKEIPVSDGWFTIIFPPHWKLGIVPYSFNYRETE